MTYFTIKHNHTFYNSFVYKFIIDVCAIYTIDVTAMFCDMCNTL